MGDGLSLLGNILWIGLGGWLICLEYLVGGVALCLTIVGIPFGLQCFKLGILSLFPFGERVVVTRVEPGCLTMLLNAVWLLVAGIWIALTHIVLAIALAVTIIGIPFAIQHVKLAEISLTPFGKSME
jgi:uncharacterized membrane protein YccF (DUF307 family)